MTVERTGTRVQRDILEVAAEGAGQSGDVSVFLRLLEEFFGGELPNEWKHAMVAAFKRGRAQKRAPNPDDPRPPRYVLHGVEVLVRSDGANHVEFDCEFFGHQATSFGAVDWALKDRLTQVPHGWVQVADPNETKDMWVVDWSITDMLYLKKREEGVSRFQKP